MFAGKGREVCIAFAMHNDKLHRVVSKLSWVRFSRTGPRQYLTSTAPLSKACDCFRFTARTLAASLRLCVLRRGLRRGKLMFARSPVQKSLWTVRCGQRTLRVCRTSILLNDHSLNGMAWWLLGVGCCLQPHPWCPRCSRELPG